MLGGLKNLRRLASQPYYIPRLFITQDARQNAFENGRLQPTGPYGSSNGDMPGQMLVSAQPPSGFDFNVTPAYAPTPAPGAQNNPLLTPSLALSFAENNLGR